MNQQALKQAAATAAFDYVEARLERDMVIGVGTGSTTNLFIEALAVLKDDFEGAVASSEESARRLRAAGLRVLDLNAVGGVPLYVDGADEVNDHLQLIKGGGGALTREKIIAATAQEFICIADESKFVKLLGRFPLPVEIIPLARGHVARQLVKLSGDPVWREDFTTDNGCQILDVHHLSIMEPRKLEREINQIVGVVTNGLFADRGADRLFLGTKSGVETHLPRNS